MKTLIIGLILVISPLSTYGHNPLSARYFIEANEKVSLLTISLSQDGVNQALLEAFDLSSLSQLNQSELEEMIVAYVRGNFNLSLDGKDITLKQGGIKLGSHQTDLKFVLPPFSSAAEKVDVHIPAFQENTNHQTIFSYKINSKSDHVILSSNNGYESTIWLRNSAEQSNTVLYIVGGFLLLCLLLMSAHKFSSLQVRAVLRTT